VPVDLRVDGANKLDAISRQLKETGDKDLRKLLMSGMQRAGKPLKVAAAQAARDNLPRKGGLAEWVASSKFSVATRGGRDPSVRIVARKVGHDLAALDRGRLRHPLFGNRRHWFNQQIRPGWFSDAMTAQAPAVRTEVVRVLDQVADAIAAKAR
jgi:hypothetical protein